MGGEFEIDFNILHKLEEKATSKYSEGYLYSSGRAALYYILAFSRQIGKKGLLLPDFLCQSILEIVKDTSIPYSFYNINSDLSINLDSLKEAYRPNYQILIINYFGGIDVVSEINKIKSIDIDASIILDNVQALYSMFESFDVDFMFTSFRKQLPVPDGAWVLTKYNGLKYCKKENTFTQYKLSGAILKSLRKFNIIKDELYLSLFEMGEKLINENIHSTISDFSVKILNKTDLNLIKKKRIENASFLIEGLHKIGLKSLLEFKNGHVPIFVPVLLKDRDFVRNKLKENDIYCPVHWPRFEETALFDQKLYDEELSLIIDQRYGKKEMRKQLIVLEKALYNES